MPLSPVLSSLMAGGCRKNQQVLQNDTVVTGNHLQKTMRPLWRFFAGQRLASGADWAA